MICLPKQSNKKISEETAALTSVCEEAFIEGEKDRKHYTVLEEKKNRRCSVLLGTGSCETEFFVQEDLKSESVKLARRLSLLALSVSENIKNDSLPQVIIDYVFQISVTLDKLKSNIGSSFAGATVHYARKSSTMVDFKTTLERRKMEIGEIPCRWLKKSPQGINRFSIYGASENSSFGCQFHWVPNTQAVPSDLVSEHNSSFWLKMKEQLDKIKEGVNVDQDCLQKMNILEQISTDIESLQTETAYPSLHSSDAVFETQRRHQIPHSQEHIEHIVSLNLMMKRKLKILANNARKRHREKVRWFVHPRSRMKTLFDLFVCLLVLYSAIITPFELAFGPINRRGYNAFELFASFLFMFDIAIIFCTAFEDQGKLVYDRRRISIKYLKGTFVLDVLGSFPFGAILSSSHSSNIIRLARLSRFLRMAKMLKVGLLIFRLNRKLQSVDFSFYIESSVVSLASRVAKIVYISHLIACAWFSLDQCNRTWEAQDWSRCGADAVGSHYLAAIYFTYTTMMTVGYGDVALITGAERAFSVVVQIIGTLVMGVLVSSIGELVGSWDLHSRYLAERMSSLKVYASEKKLSRDLRIKLHKHFLYFYLHTTVFPEQTVIKSLPYSVCEKLTLEQHSDHLENLVLFKQLYSNGHKDFVLEALPLLKPMQVQGSEVVICQGDPAEELYFVLQGHINSFRTESNSVQVLTGIYSDGSTLNLEEILCHRDMYCTMQTACVSDLLWIYKEDIEMLLRSFPNVNLPLRSSAKETLKNTLRILSSETIREHIGNVTMPVKAIIRCEPIEKGKEPTLAICSASLASQLDVLNRLHMDQKSLRTIQSASARNLGGKKISTRSLNYALNIDSEVVKQDETEDSLQGKFFIDPDHKYKRIWDVMIMILTLFSVIYIPYRLAFYSHRDIQALKYTDLVIDCFYCVDIVLTFRTLFKVVPGGGGTEVFVADSRLIALRYVKTWFFFDLVSSFPFQIIVPLLGRKPNTVSLSGRFARIIRFVRFFKLLRILRFGRLTRKFRVNMSEAHAYYRNQLVQLSIILLYLGHFLGCLFVFMAYEEGPENSWMADIPAGHLLDVAHADMVNQYVASVYWAFTTLSTVGYGDIKPTNDRERMYTTALILIGATVFAYIIGNVSNLLHQLTVLASLDKTKLLEVNEYTKEQKYSKKLTLSIRKHMFFTFATQTSKIETEILQHLPARMRGQMLLHSVAAVIKRIAIFHPEDSQQFVSLVFQRMTPEFHEAGSFIYTPKSGSQGLYFVTSGVVEEVDPSRSTLSPDEWVVFCTVEQGGFFGHRMYLNLSHNNAGARTHAQTDCHLYVLYTQALNNLHDQFPSASQKLRNVLGKYFIEQHFLTKRSAVCSSTTNKAPEK